VRDGERSSAGTDGAAESVETGWRVKVTERMADRAAPEVVQPRFVCAQHGRSPNGVQVPCMKTRTMKMENRIPAEVKGRRVTVFLKEDYAKPVCR
jgi:hypothetical protein